MSIGYFPSLLPDELLYSQIARFARHRGLSVDGSLATELFGRRHAVAAIDLPGGLEALSRRVGPEGRHGVDAMIDQATLHPFYAATASPRVVAATRLAMAGSSSGVHTRFGIAAFRIPVPTRVRFCRLCLREMEQTHGERYWRRSHQLPGIVVCPDHGASLVSAATERIAGRHRYLSAEIATRIDDGTAQPPELTGIARQSALELAIAASALLDRRHDGVEPDRLAVGYRQRLLDVGLASRSGRVDQQRLRAGLELRWGALLPQVFGPRERRGDAWAWLVPLLGGRPRACHPVLHLMLGAYLDTLGAADQPFGSGPWPCRNPAASHVGSAVVTKLTVRRSGLRLFGDHECGCGFVYTIRRDPDGAVSAPRYRTYGPLFRPALLAELAAGTGLRATAGRLGLDPKTLMREAALAGVEVPWTTCPSGSTVSRLERRSDGVSTTAGKGACPRPCRPSRWDLIDCRLAKRMAVHAADIVAERPPIRVTMVEIERRAAKPGWIQKRRHKLPLTSMGLSELVERTDDFRMRRLRFYVERTRQQPCTTPSDVLRASGLPLSWMATVRREMHEFHIGDARGRSN